MLLMTSFLSWWYGDGWRRRVQTVAGRIDSLTDYFSFSLLLKTLFSPYRQISAGKVDGPIDVQSRAMLDKLFSRVIGAVFRLLIMFIGGIMIVATVIYGVIFLVGWAIVPALPAAGLVMFLTGWVP